MPRGKAPRTPSQKKYRAKPARAIIATTMKDHKRGLDSEREAISSVMAAFSGLDLPVALSL